MSVLHLHCETRRQNHAHFLRCVVITLGSVLQVQVFLGFHRVNQNGRPNCVFMRSGGVNEIILAQRDRQTDRHTYIHTDRQTDGQTDRQTQKDRRTDRRKKTGRQTGAAISSVTSTEQSVHILRWGRSGCTGVQTGCLDVFVSNHLGDGVVMGDGCDNDPQQPAGTHACTQVTESRDWSPGNSLVSAHHTRLVTKKSSGSVFR